VEKAVKDMKMKGSPLVAIFFLLLGLFGVIQSLTFHYWESIALPLVISSVIVVLAVIEVVKEFRRREKKEAGVKEKSEEEHQDNTEIRRFGLVFGWAAGLSLAIYLLGFYISVPIFTFTYLKCRGRSWLTAVIFTIPTLAIIYLVFNVGLNTQLYEGIIFGAR
jgi:small-conductance mechanosensitive channel